MGILRGIVDEIEVNAKADISGDLGKVHKLQFKAKFRRREYEEAQGLIRAMNDPDTDVTEATIIRDDLVSWRDLQGDGGEVEYSHENLEAMLGHAEYRAALFSAWGQAQLGRLMANAKN